MKLLAAIFTTVVFLAACARKSVPVITSRESRPFNPVASVYSEAGTVVADTVHGKSVFISACQRCHGLPDITLYSSGQWEDVLERMIPRTRMGKENAVHVRAYILSKAKQP